MIVLGWFVLGVLAGLLVVAAVVETQRTLAQIATDTRDALVMGEADDAEEDNQ